jgi:lysozyme
VSEFQQTIDWSQVAASGLGFAIARASDGFYHDSTFAQNWAGMKANGIVRGAYQYFRASEDGKQQADDFLSLVTFAPGDLPPFLDVETLDGMSPNDLATQMTAWIQEIQTVTGMSPLIYTSEGLWDGWGMPSFAQQGLWVANYGVSSPKIPSGWTGWSFWQYSGNVTVAGIPAGGADGDQFNGTAADLAAFVGAQPPQPASGSPAPSAPSSSSLAATIATGPTLQQGSSGQAVTDLQNALAAAGFSPGPADGQFGPNTKAAVVAFQNANGLTPDGIVGPLTRAALAAALSGSPASSSSPAPASAPAAPAAPAPATLGYASDIAPLLTNCAQCHSSGSGRTDLTNYQGVLSVCSPGSSSSSQIIKKLNGSMGQYLNQASDEQTIATWINQGCNP